MSLVAIRRYILAQTGKAPVEEVYTAGERLFDATVRDTCPNAAKHLTLVGKQTTFPGEDQNGITYWDTNHGFILNWDERPVACVGFEFEWDSLCIKQLQGMPDERRGYAGARPEDTFVKLLASICHELAIGELRMIAAHQNYWFLNALTKRQARMRGKYDGTAKRLGFTWNKTKQRYVLSTR